MTLNEPLSGPEGVTVEVATVPKVVAPVHIGIFPITGADEVESPLKVPVTNPFE
jgi:hypothetical protein